MSIAQPFDVFTFGETMIRLTPPDGGRLEAAAALRVDVGGAESNVAVALARLGKRSAWASRLPDNPLGHLVLNTLRGFGVDTSGVVFAPGERIGSYFLEPATPPRPAKVWYDRAGSAASKLTRYDLPYTLLKESRWLHVTGITPALGDGPADAVRAAIDFAKDHGVMVSFDVNYRGLLWSPDKAAAALEPFCKLADIVFCAQRDSLALFGTGDIVALQSRFGGTIVMTNGSEGALACNYHKTVHAPAYPATIVERLGAGDAFAAATIAALLDSAPLEDAIRFGCAAAALKLTIPGDLALISKREVDALIGSAAVAGGVHR